MHILLPERRADPTRRRELIFAHGPADVQRELQRQRYAERGRRALAAAGLAAVGGGGPQTNQWIEPVFSNLADGPQVVSVAAETALLNLTGSGQPWLYPGFFGTQTGAGKVLEFEATGVLQATGTPTYTWFARLGTTQNVVTGTIIAQSAAITTASSPGAGTYWEMKGRILCQKAAIGSGNATIVSSATIHSGNGFAAPYTYPMEVSAPPNATWTTTLDGSASLYLMLSVTPSASSASNNVTLKTLKVWATSN